MTRKKKDKRSSNETKFKRHTTWFLKKHPNASAREIQDAFRKKGGSINRTKANQIVREKKGTEFNVSKARLKHKTITDNSPVKYKSEYSYIVTFYQEGYDNRRAITLSRSNKMSRKQIMEEVETLLHRMDRRGKQLYNYQAIEFSSIKIEGAFYNPNPEVYA